MPRASLFLLCALLLLSSSSSFKGASATTINVINHCPYPIWPGVQSNAGSITPEVSGFPLLPGAAFPVLAPYSWSGRIWARTKCSVDHSTSNFSCGTGNCASGAVACNGFGPKPPASLAEFKLGSSAEDAMDHYQVSLAHGFNVPLKVAPMPMPMGLGEKSSGHDDCTVTRCDDEQCPAANKDHICPTAKTPAFNLVFCPFPQAKLGNPKHHAEISTGHDQPPQHQNHDGHAHGHDQNHQPGHTESDHHKKKKKKSKNEERPQQQRHDDHHHHKKNKKKNKNEESPQQQRHDDHHHHKKNKKKNKNEESPQQQRHDDHHHHQKNKKKNEERPQQHHHHHKKNKNEERPQQQRHHDPRPSSEQNIGDGADIWLHIHGGPPSAPAAAAAPAPEPASLGLRGFVPINVSATAPAFKTWQILSVTALVVALLALALLFVYFIFSRKSSGVATSLV